MPCMPNGIFADSSLEFVMRKQDDEDMWMSEDESPKVVSLLKMLSEVQGLLTGLHFQKAHTHSGTSCPQCVYQIW